MPIKQLKNYKVTSYEKPIKTRPLTDEHFQGVDDIEEIQKLLENTAEDESCSE